MPKARLEAPMSVPYTDEMLGIPDNMIDTDNMQTGVEAIFNAGASLREGLSGKKSIDTEFENFSEDEVDSSRNRTAPMQVNKHEFPHRGY